MKFQPLRRAMCPLLVFTAVCAIAGAQTTPNQRLNAVRTQLMAYKAFVSQLPSNKQSALSSGAQNALQLALHWDDLGKEVPGLPELLGRLPLSGTLAGTPAVASMGMIPVSDPASDYAFSPLSGFVQSETSTAWCGPNAVVGFNDSGSFWETLVGGTGGLSFNGYGQSSVQGMSFTDQGALPPGSNPKNFLLGDPAISCTDANRFFYSSIFETADSNGNPLTAVSVSKSMDGGMTFGDPVVAVAKDGLTHFLDKTG